MTTRRLRPKKELIKPPSNSISAPSNRPRRAAAQASAAATTSALDRETDSPDEPRPEKQAIKLKVGSRLREVEKPSITVGGRKSGGTRDSFEGGEIIVGSRPTRPRKKAIVEETSEDEEGEEADGDEEEDEDAEGDEDDDAQGNEDAEGDDDVDMEDAPPAVAAVKVGGASGIRTKPSVTITPAKDDKLPGVEDQEMAMDDDDDEELSELESQEEEGGEEDAEGEEDEEMDAEGDEEEDAEGDSDEDDDDETPASISRSNTPDPSKLTRRQRGEFEGGLMALSNEAQKKKHLTAEEHAARRAEMARRRKNLSEKRNEEEKMDTINRLLKKQAPKRRGRREIDPDGGDETMDLEEFRPSPIYVRTVSNASGSMVAVPEEYMEAENISGVFKGGVTGGKPTPFRGRMVEEVEAN
ncbi:hypothetical protein NA57DRAFT_81590 [Rhizodiscina lignyota]|uniref:INO80 complex subunit B-like conserved region domain-containing protein n=1 Tax=Rhizodiscina lignyota TaxID=1504668 RepID=A0A9P4M181_9PEZI|nr:hypothetical protein NA57DRAFT_81590 [Rhizodiscina lignyota]